MQQSDWASVTEWTRQEEASEQPLVTGTGTGLEIPVHALALLAMGADGLTRLFRAFGSIEADDRVANIVAARSCPGGSTGHKMFLTVELDERGSRTAKDLFVKFSRDFTDPVRDNRGKFEMETEIRFAALANAVELPVAVPKPYFADFDTRSHSGVLITEQVPFGRDGIAPHRPKCRDHELDNPLAHYEVLVDALAALAAAHRSGALGDAVDRFLPPRETTGIALGMSPDELTAKPRRLTHFIAEAPHLFADATSDAAFLEAFPEEAARFSSAESEIARFLASDPNMVALCHWNANIDNAWFWTGADGELRCGLMDWGNAGQMNLAFPLWGCLSGAPVELLKNDLDALFARFCAGLANGGGPVIAPETLKLHFRLYVAMAGLAYFLDTPDRIVARMPDVRSLASPRDPALDDHESVRNQLHMANSFLTIWRCHNISDALDILTGGLMRARRASGARPYPLPDYPERGRSRS